MNTDNSAKCLLMISYPFPPNPSAGAVRSERFARYLSESGWEIDVITIRPQQNRQADDSDMAGRNISVHRTNTIDPWLWLSERAPKNIILRAVRSVLMRVFSFPDHMLLWLPFALIAGLKVCKEKRVCAIYTTSPPHSSQIIGYFLAMITGIPWVSDFRDPWTLNAYRNTGFVNEVLIKLSEIMERAVYRKASYVFANTQANKDNLLKAFSELSEQKVVYLPNGWESFDNDTAVYDDEGTFTVLHAGTFYPRFKPYALLFAIASWKNGLQPEGIPALDELDLKIKLYGSKDSETKKLVNDLAIEKYVEIIPWVPQAEVRKRMRSADLLWVTLGTGHESSTYVPSKLFEYIAAKKTIIGFFPEGEAANIIKVTNTGRVFSDDSPDPVIQYLYDRICLKKETRETGYTPDEVMIESYNIKAITQKLSGLLSSLGMSDNKGA
jgi:hypothetical protein